jgi:hypothetical protein
MLSGRRAAMAASCRAVTSDAERLDEEDLARPSRCLGWTRADLLYHLLLDAQRALVAFAAPATALGHVMAAGDFLATLTVEATIHHLDLVAGGRDLAGPPGLGLAVARETFDGILGQPVPAGWTTWTTR